MNVEVVIKRRSIFIEAEGRELPYTDALITDGDQHLTSRQPGWHVGEEYFRADYLTNVKNGKRFLP